MTIKKKKMIKAERVKKIFAETTVHMIKETGIESVSVRKVAEKSAYSLGTLYNHFKNLDELLWYTKILFIDEITNYIEKRTKKKDITELFKTYMDYFVENENVFKFFFFTSLDKSKKTEFNIAQVMNVDKSTREAFEQLKSSRNFTSLQLEARLKTLLYSIHGMLMIHVTDSEDLTKEALYKDFSMIAENLFH